MPAPASLFLESLYLSTAPKCRLDLAPDSAVCDPWWVSKGGKGLELMRKQARGRGRGELRGDCPERRGGWSPLPSVMASSISEIPGGPAQGVEPCGSASCEAWQVQTSVFIKCPAGPGGAGSPGSAEMLQVHGLARWWGRGQGKLQALLCL